MSLASHRELRLPGLAGEELGASGMDLLMWVGYTSYPTVEAFSHEAQDIGISKRVSRIPGNLVPGSTRLWIAHDSGAVGAGEIVGYGIVTGVDVIGDRLPDDAPSYARLVSRQERWHDKPRGGQVRSEGIYIQASDWTAVRPRKAVDIQRYRSYKWVSRRRMEMLPMADPALEPDKIEPTHRWSKEEYDTFITRAREVGPYQAAKEHARISERSLEASMYQWKKYLRSRRPR